MLRLFAVKEAKYLVHIILYAAKYVLMMYLCALLLLILLLLLLPSTYLGQELEFQKTTGLLTLSTSTYFKHYSVLPIPSLLGCLREVTTLLQK